MKSLNSYCIDSMFSLVGLCLRIKVIDGTAPLPTRLAPTHHINRNGKEAQFPFRTFARVLLAPVEKTFTLGGYMAILQDVSIKSMYFV